MATVDAVNGSAVTQTNAGRRKGAKPSDIVFHIVMTLYAMLFFLPLLWMAM